MEPVKSVLMSMQLYPQPTVTRWGGRSAVADSLNVFSRVVGENLGSKILAKQNE